MLFHFFPLTGTFAHLPPLWKCICLHREDEVAASEGGSVLSASSLLIMADLIHKATNQVFVEGELGMSLSHGTSSSH